MDSVSYTRKTYQPTKIGRALRRKFRLSHNRMMPRLPYELQCMILYRFGGLEHPTAKIMKPLIAASIENCLWGEYEFICEYVIDLHYSPGNKPIPSPSHPTEIYEGGVTYEEFFLSFRMKADMIHKVIFIDLPNRVYDKGCELYGGAKYLNKIGRNGPRYFSRPLY